MSFIAHGLKCTDPDCDLVEPHVFYHKADGPPPCPECGGPRKITWSHRQFPGVTGDGIGSFTAMDMGVFGRVETREEYNQVMAVIKERHPNAQIQVEGDSQADKQLRADEARQRAYDRHRSNSLDAKMMKEMKEECETIKAAASSDATRQNLNPKPAAVSAAKKLASPAALATGGRIGQTGASDA